MPQTGALPTELRSPYLLGAGNEVRTRDIQLGRLTLYQLSYSRIALLYYHNNFILSIIFYLEATTRFELVMEILQTSALPLGDVATILINGAQRRNRTTDTGIFSPLLYRLSYLGTLLTN